ncbi:MAG: hypothetical protein WC943_01630 [Elusimicrobiota bacterium]|jgi:hypothetical protein
MAFLTHLLSLCLVLAGPAFSQTVRTAPVRVRTVPAGISASAVAPASQGLNLPVSQTLSAPSISLPALSIAPLNLPAPEIGPAAPALPPGTRAEVPTSGRSSVESQIRRITESVAEPLKTAEDDKASPDQTAGAGRDMEKALTGEGPAPVQQEDLPPAGPVAGLDAGQIAWLQNEFVTGPRPLLTDPGFQTFILGDSAAADKIVPWLRNERQALALSLNALVGCLRRVAESGLPPMERSRLGQELNDALSRNLAALSRHQGLNPKQRNVLSEVQRRFLANRAALFELTHYLQTVRALKRLDGQVQGLLAPAPAQPSPAAKGPAADQAQTKVEHPWNIKPAPPKEERGRTRDTEVSLVNRTGDWASTIKEWQFLVEKNLSRYRISMDRKFPQRIKEAMAQRLIKLLEDYRRKAGVLFGGVERVASYSLVNSFLNPHPLAGRQRRIVWVPDNRNLRLIPETGGFVVKASFETDIQDDAVLRAFKSSIEEYWQGDFQFRGQTHSFRVEISLTKLAPGQAFSQGSLSVRDNDQWLSLAGPDVILLSRELNYATPAHEFGHTMGLADEYRNGYDPDQRASVELQNPASIMSSLSGAVLPRHLLQAYLLLKRRSL